MIHLHYKIGEYHIRQDISKKKCLNCIILQKILYFNKILKRDKKSEKRLKLKIMIINNFFTLFFYKFCVTKYFPSFK